MGRWSDLSLGFAVAIGAATSITNEIDPWGDVPTMEYGDRCIGLSGLGDGSVA